IINNKSADIKTAKRAANESLSLITISSFAAVTSASVSVHGATASFVFKIGIIFKLSSSSSVACKFFLLSAL
ncbi:unnamed protein product, partial [Rotaria socialis]